VNITNMHGAPESILQAVTADPYTKGEADFSVTELIKPPQINRLWAEHENKISMDVRDEFWKLLGRGVHNVLEQYSDGGVSEERHFAKVGDLTVSGAIDLVSNGMVTDYKVTSTYSVMKGLKPEWEQQLNMYSWLLRQNDISSSSLRIVALCRDWIRSRSDRSQKYPASPIVILPVPKWPDEQQDQYIEERVRVHMDESTIPCTSEERWARGRYMVTGTDVKLKKPKLFDTLMEASVWTQGKENPAKGIAYQITETTPTYVRCEGNWCGVRDFCPQYQGGEVG
tara:strand:+ start:83 stop:931 length:849 start_codon:yes stop_codon:yes gene_type:complete